MSCQVSVVVVSYNPVCEKLLTSLQRIIDQKNISLEIILCDDCSPNGDCFGEAQKLFEKNNFKDYKMHRNDVNQGTVKNFYEGILMSQGEYIFMGSPGDYLYDVDTLKNLYNFAKEKKAKVCFGDVVYYSFETELKIYEGISCGLYNVHAYDENREMSWQKISYLVGNIPVGAAIFRERQYALNYVGIVRNVCRYLEDASLEISTFDNVRAYFYSKFVLWYEYGTGLSTNLSGNHNLLAKDEQSLYEYLNHEHPDNKLLGFHKADRSNNKIVRRCLLLTKYLHLYLIKKILQKDGTKLKYRRAIDTNKFPVKGW